METARVDFEELKEQLSTAIEGLSTVSRAVGQITTRLHAAQGSSSVGESWVRTWGETLPKKAAAKMLGVSVTYLNKLISESALKAMSTLGIVLLYSVGGRQYLQLTSWQKHQTIRAQHSKYPAPNAADMMGCDYDLSILTMFIDQIH